MFRWKCLLLTVWLCCAEGAAAFTRIVQLRTDAMESPLGLDDAHPCFSWQMRSDRIGARQQAYRILVADGAESFAAGDWVYDSGTVLSDASLNIPYKGRALHGARRYFWKVEVTDETGAVVESEPSWFETGLMHIGWGKAEWIGSEAVGLSKYRTFFNIDYTVRIPEGSRRAVFAYSVQDEGNYITTELNLDCEGAPCFIVEYAVAGATHHLATIPLGRLVTSENRHAEHRVHLKVTTPGYHLKSQLVISFDGEMLKPAGGSSGNPYQLEITPYPAGERVHDWARLHAIGFKQPAGERACFSDISISESNWNTVLYTDPIPCHELTGTGSLDVWEPYGQVSAPMLRRNLELGKAVKSARLYVTARGIYEFYINGKRVGNDYFNPGWTDYRYRIMYNTYDVTDLLHQGSNGLGAMLGAGWYSDLNIFSPANVDPYGIRQSLLAKLMVVYEDGTTENIVTDGSWKRYDHGPVVRNGFQFGEDYDARKEVDGWMEGGFDDSSWAPAILFERPAASVQLQAYVGLPVRNHLTLEAISVTEPVKGTFVYDFGQNVVGVPRIEGLRGCRGTRITLRYGEMVYPDRLPTDPVPPYTVELYERMRGQLYTENYRGALSIDTYTLRGDCGEESYQPIFTNHGFRYLSVSGLSEPLPVASVKAVVLESIGHPTCRFTTSDDRVNRLFENILWGQRGNFQSIPTDCPQRDERQGWTGDAQVFARTATYFSPWVNSFYARWFYSMRDNQNTDGSYFNYYPVTGRPPYGYTNDKPGWIGWMEAGIIVPYQVYMQYGDLRVVEEHYDSMVRYMEYLERASSDYLQPAEGIGDHLAIEPTDVGLTNTAYYAYDALLMSRMAAALGRTDDSLRYARLYENVKKAFCEHYMRSDGTTVAPSAAGEPRVVDTQTSYLLPLYFNLLDGTLRERAVARLVENIERHGHTLTTGFIGTPYLNPVLSENACIETAYALFEQTRCPSWLYPILQGATTMWERWNSYTIENGFGPVDMNSFNHYAYGAIGEWMYAYCLGIQRDEEQPAYKHFVLQPQIGGSLRFACGGFETPYGPVESGWEKTAHGYRYRVTVPANTTAALMLQASAPARVKILQGANGVGPLQPHDGGIAAELRSGTYVFEVEE